MALVKDAFGKQKAFIKPSAPAASPKPRAPSATPRLPTVNPPRSAPTSGGGYRPSATSRPGGTGVRARPAAAGAGQSASRSAAPTVQGRSPQRTPTAYQSNLFHKRDTQVRRPAQDSGVGRGVARPGAAVNDRPFWRRVADRLQASAGTTPGAGQYGDRGSAPDPAQGNSPLRTPAAYQSDLFRNRNFQGRLPLEPRLQAKLPMLQSGFQRAVPFGGASGQRPGRTPAPIVPREQPTVTAAEILENIRARESGRPALPRFDDAEQQRQEQRMQRIANMRTAPEERQAQLQQFARLAKTRMWSGSDGLRGLAAPPKAIAEHEDLYRLLSRLPSDFPVEGWEKLPCKRQLALMEKTDLSREEQWTFLNAPAVITTLGKIQDLQLNRTAYGLSAAQIERTSDELMLLANARLEANGADSPFRETKAKQRFLRMLDMREEEVMESMLHGGKEQLTGYEKVGYDERGEPGGEEPEIITFRTRKPNPEIIVIPGKAPTPTPRPISVPTPTPDNRFVYEQKLRELVETRPGVTPIPYVYGGKNPQKNGLDCSGFVQYGLVESGIPLIQKLDEEVRFSSKSYSAEGLYRIFKNENAGYGAEIWNRDMGRIHANSLQPGDILYFTNDKNPRSRPDIKHVTYYSGINASGNMVVMEASGRTGKVQEEEIFFDKDNRRMSTGQYLYAVTRPNYQYTGEE